MKEINLEKIGLGGGCHWCTEGIFQSLKGVKLVEQGWVSSAVPNNSYSEAVLVHFNRDLISLHTLIEIHIHTHSSTSNHALRKKYRSAIYTNTPHQTYQATEILNDLQSDFSESLITEVLPLIEFKMNSQDFLDYYYNDPDKPFCKNFIQPKLKLLLTNFSNVVDKAKLSASGI